MAEFLTIPLLISAVPRAVAACLHNGHSWMAFQILYYPLLAAASGTAATSACILSGKKSLGAISASFLSPGCLLVVVAYLGRNKVQRIFPADKIILTSSRFPGRQEEDFGGGMGFASQLQLPRL